MKRQIRRSIFESNSSSTHSLVMCMKRDYDKWSDGKLYLYDGWGFGYAYLQNDKNIPEEGHFYTKEECIAFIKRNKYYDSNKLDELTADEFDEYVKEFDFKTYENYDSDDLECFEEELTTPSGEKVVAFGKYGYE